MEESKIFNAFSYSLAQLRALGKSIFVHSLSSDKERTKKADQGA